MDRESSVIRLLFLTCHRVTGYTHLPPPPPSPQPITIASSPLPLTHPSARPWHTSVRCGGVATVLWCRDAMCWGKSVEEEGRGWEEGDGLGVGVAGRSEMELISLQEVFNYCWRRSVIIIYILLITDVYYLFLYFNCVRVCNRCMHEQTVHIHTCARNIYVNTGIHSLKYIHTRKTHIHTQRYTNTREISTYVQMKYAYTCTISIFAHTSIYLYTNTHTNIFTYMHAHECIYTRIHTHTHRYISIFTHTETHSKRTRIIYACGICM